MEEQITIKTGQKFPALSYLLTEVFDNALVAIVIADTTPVINYVNAEFTRLFGYTREETLGKRITQLIAVDENSDKLKEVKNQIDSGGRIEYETLRRTKDGRIIPVYARISPIIINGKIVGGYSFYTDISGTKEAQSRIIQQEKMVSIGQLAAGVAHEINNPTGFVSSNLNTLSVYIKDYNNLINKYRDLMTKMEQDGLSEEYTDSMNEIKAMEERVDIDFLIDDVASLIKESREGTDRIEKIVQDLKDFAHPGEGKPQYADVNKCIESTLNIVWNEIKYKAQVVKDYGSLPEILCYPQQLNQVFTNLFINAAQAINNEGEIRIKTSLSNEIVEIIVSDTGTGILEQDISKVFDPFFTTKEVGKGTGLGLNVAYNIIKKHQGESFCQANSTNSGSL